MLYICGSKEKYRKVRDTFAIMTHYSAVKTLCSKVAYVPGMTPNSALLPYDVLIELVSLTDAKIRKVPLQCTKSPHL